MKSPLERYVEKIINQTNCSRKEREDLSEELLSHLEQSRDELMKNENISKKEAELAAMNLFGSEKTIGHGLQQALYPFRKELLLSLSLSSLFFTITVYLLQLFLEGDAHVSWLLLSLSLSTLFLLMAIHPLPFRKSWMNSLFLLHGMTYVYGYGLISSFEETTYFFLVILNWTIIVISLILLYQTTVHNEQAIGELASNLKRLHQLNFGSGTIIFGLTLFFLWIGLFIFNGFHLNMLFLLIPFILWVLCYIGQIKMIQTSKKIAFSIGFISLSTSVILLLFVFFIFIQ